MVLEQVGQGALTGKIWAGLGLLRSRQEDEDESGAVLEGAEQGCSRMA